MDREEAVAMVRGLLRHERRAALATLDADGAPYVSLVAPASDVDGTPLLLISRLAPHTRNILRDPRVALLFDGTRRLVDPLAGRRMTVQGRAVREEDPRARARWSRLHPEAALYRDFADFQLFRVEVERVHLVAGFARVAELEPGEVLHPRAAVAELAAAEEGLLTELAGEHRDLVRLVVTRLADLPDRPWEPVGIDPEGFTFAADRRVVRIDVDEPVLTAQAARAAFLALVRNARAAQEEA
ncbi:hypothetical protein HRbin39_01541 [bacterium HR39]|nr:hypothetical protein HRbin39_01541 [bacterium HR39]